MDTQSSPGNKGKSSLNDTTPAAVVKATSEKIYQAAPNQTAGSAGNYENTCAEPPCADAAFAPTADIGFTANSCDERAKGKVIEGQTDSKRQGASGHGNVDMASNSNTIVFVASVSFSILPGHVDATAPGSSGKLDALPAKGLNYQTAQKEVVPSPENHSTKTATLGSRKKSETHPDEPDINGKMGLSSSSCAQTIGGASNGNRGKGADRNEDLICKKEERADATKRKDELKLNRGVRKPLQKRMEGRKAELAAKAHFKTTQSGPRRSYSNEGPRHSFLRKKKSENKAEKNEGQASDLRTLLSRPSSEGSPSTPRDRDCQRNRYRGSVQAGNRGSRSWRGRGGRSGGRSGGTNRFLDDTHRRGAKRNAEGDCANRRCDEKASSNVDDSEIRELKRRRMERFSRGMPPSNPSRRC